MKKFWIRILACALCLCLCPVSGLAAEDAGAATLGASQAKNVEEPKETLGRSGIMRAAARSGSINMSLTGFVFAEGTPIVIKQNGGITSIYDTSGNLLSGETDVSTWAVYGGWYDNKTHTADTSIVMESGTVGTIFGGSCYGALNGNTNVVIQGGDVTAIYGGGNQSPVKNIHVELKSDNTCDKTWVYGGGYKGTAEKASIVMGTDWAPLGGVIAGGDGGMTDLFEMLIQNYKPARYAQCNIEPGTAKESIIRVQRSEGGAYSTANTNVLNLIPNGIQNIVVEYGEVNIMGRSGEALRLNSLDIQSGAKMRFQDWDSIEIQELSSSGGQFLLPAQFLAGGQHTIIHTPVTVGSISVTTPLVLKAEGTGWLEEDLAKCDFFRGPGVDALDSTSGFLSEGYAVVLRDLPSGSGKGVYLTTKEPENPDQPKAVYISKHNFNESSCVYNGTLPVTVGVGKTLATADKLELIPGAVLQIRTQDAQDSVLASIQVSDDGKAATVTYADGTTKPAQVDVGYITLDLPVNAALLNTRDEGIYLLATAEGYDSSRAQMKGPADETAIQITPASVTLSKTVSDPAFTDPVKTGLEDGAFYTASVLWHTGNGLVPSGFQINRDYQADIILSPKPGHWLSPDSIGNKVTYNGREMECVFNTDGTVTLENVKSVRFEGYTVTAAASPAEGGTVTGAGVYPAGSQVTVTADAGAGWQFEKWTENGREVSRSAEYTFTLQGNRTLTAVFVEEETTKELKTETKDFTEVPDGLKNHSLFNTVKKIKAELRRRVQVAISGVGDQIVVYDVTLLYRENNSGPWMPVTPENFPTGGVSAVLEYPEGTNGTDYTFTIQHMISSGERAGTVEEIPYTAGNDGLHCHFTSLSPVAIGWQQKGTETPEPTPPPVTPGRPSAPVSTGSGGGSSSDPVQNDEYDFWQSVRKKIEAAGRGDTVTVNPRGYERMPKSVMDALRQKDGVTLVLLRDGGEEIVIPSEKALDEAMQVYYPLPYLEGIDFGAGEPVLSRVEESGSKPNPGTGGWNPAWGPVKN